MSDFKPKKFGCGRYIQEPDAYKCLGREVEFLKGTKALVIGGQKGIEASKDRIEESLGEAHIAFEYEPLTTDVTYDTLEKMKADLAAKNCDIVIATGGGKGMDMAKAVAHTSGTPLVCLPSSLGTFNCWSAMSVMYTPEHKPLDRIWYEEENNCVILDTKLLAEEPVKNFASGMADCLAKYIETGFMLETKNVNTMPADMYTSKVMAQATNDICMNKGEKAYRDCIAHEVTQEFEDCTFAVVATTAIAAAANYANKNALLGAAKSEGARGCSFSHGLYYAARKMYTEECWGFLHGEIVGLGLRANNAVYGRSEFETKNLCRFLDSIGQPATLKEIGMRTGDKDLEDLCDCIMTVWGKHPDWHREIILDGLHMIKG